MPYRSPRDSGKFTHEIYNEIILAKFDMHSLNGYLFTELQKRHGNVSVLKKENKYFSINSEHIIFKASFFKIW